jgi:hypothetical protein
MSNTKASWLANAKRIALEVDALEKKTGTGLRSDELKYESIDMVRLRNEAKADTIKRVHGIRLVLTNIQDKIKMNTWQSSNALKNQLETFESKLSSFKMLMRSAYDTLEDSATSLETEINKLNGEMDMWDHASVEPDISGVPDPDTQKRISERNKTDLERRAFIGALDRKVNYLVAVGLSFILRLEHRYAHCGRVLTTGIAFHDSAVSWIRRSRHWAGMTGGTPGTTMPSCAYG